jgi:prepilin-type processing-associated H-X9-DG protein
MTPLPTTAKPSGNHRRNTAALTLMEVVLVVAILVILAGLLLLARSRVNDRCCYVKCVNGLKQIGVGFRLWEGDHNGKNPMQVSVADGGTRELVAQDNVFPHFEVMSNELSTPEILLCPNDSERTRISSFTNGLQDQNISYFIGVDAETNRPLTILAGDRNLAVDGVPAKHGLLQLRTNSTVWWYKPRIRHGNGGNILFADASVQQLTTKALQKALRATGSATNRLVIP